MDFQLLDVYDYKRGEHVIGPFSYKCIAHAKEIAGLPDSWIRKVISLTAGKVISLL